MIPIKLKLSNFTSYTQSPELDFTKFKLAAISGLNGAGKSSLLDAITWCVWGSSRAGDSSDALVRLGQTEMYVEFSFELDGQVLTVKRKRIKKSGGNTALELWSGSKDEPQTHNLTEGTIKATQQKIVDSLHLTYETFTNSSFIRQGHADEFTMHGPTDRKRILADILGLDHYDRLEEKAKEKIKEAQIKLTLLEYQILEIEAELSQKEQRQKQFDKLQEDVEIAKGKTKDSEEQVQKTELQKQTIEVTVKTLLEKKQRFESLRKELAELKLQIDLKEKSKSEYQTILDDKQLIEKSYGQLTTLKDARQKLENKRSQLLELKNDLTEIEKVIDAREDKRKNAIAQLEIQIKEFQTKNEQLEIQNKKLSDNKAVCPTCGQTIDERLNNELLETNRLQIKINNSSLAEIANKIEKFRAVVLPEVKSAKEKEQKIQNLERETKHYSQLQAEIDKLQKFEGAYLKLQQAEVAVGAHSDALVELQKIYSVREEETEKIKNFDQELDLYSKQLDEVTQKLEKDLLVKKACSQILLELTGRAGEQKQLIDRTAQMESLFKTKSEEKTKLSKEKELFEELSLAFGKKGIQAMIIENAIPEIEDETNKLLEKLTEGRMKVALETQKETKTKVQTSAGKIHATVETLDIIISDEMGERAYENYSGGEQFRVNFAIRIAISRLLANRAGAKLQFLVIDEGFGTQDAAGRTRLVEVIDAIKDDFEKIIIITHLEELKEEFPVRIEVSKTAHGSSFEVVGI